MKIYLGAEKLDAELALTEEQEQTGMMFRTNILETDAMLFVFARPTSASFWMKNCPESLSAAYIGPDGVIQEIHHLEKNDTNRSSLRPTTSNTFWRSRTAGLRGTTSTPAPSSARKKARCEKRFSPSGSFLFAGNRLAASACQRRRKKARADLCWHSPFVSQRLLVR